MKKILLIDDESEFINVAFQRISNVYDVRMYLDPPHEVEGRKIAKVERLGTIEKMYREFYPHLVISDYTLHGYHGWEIYSHLLDTGITTAEDLRRSFIPWSSTLEEYILKSFRLKCNLEVRMKPRDDAGWRDFGIFLEGCLWARP